MAKRVHEIRDPIHVFVRLDSQERDALDCWPLQRLRHVHQLGLTYLIYPGATHRRFEHSLGVMELASRVFDVVTRSDALQDSVRDQLPELANREDDVHRYWRRVLRMAALCHDIGHLPFSHAAEEELLPRGWDHERITADLIRSNEMVSIWRNMRPGLEADDIVKLALGPGRAMGTDGSPMDFTCAEEILAEIIVGHAFGVDRMDYLLRDSHHAGVAYGKFDHFRLIDTLRILPAPLSGGDDESGEPMLGVEEGGLLSAEALLLARYMMYSQVYFHPVRRIYDIHLRDFLGEWLEGGVFSTMAQDQLAMTDNEVLSAIRVAAGEPSTPGHDPARRICAHDHYRRVYSRRPSDLAKNPDAGSAVAHAVEHQFGADAVRYDTYRQKQGLEDFPVLRDDGVASSASMSDVLQSIPVVATDYVFVVPEQCEAAKRWLRSNVDDVIEPREETGDG